MKPRSFFALFAISASLGCAVTTTSTSTSPESGNSAGSFQTRADSKGSFRLELPDIDGEHVIVQAENPREIFVLVFWKTTCPPCRSQLAEFEQVHQQLKSKGAKMLAINVDSPESQAQVRTWVQRGEFSFLNLIDSETEIFSQYNAKGECPFYVALGANGKVLRNHGGYTKGDGEELRAFLEQNLSTS